MKFIVERSKWRSGGDNGKHQVGKGFTFLENKEGFMCCLGFCAKQLGYRNIVSLGEPEDIELSSDESNAILDFHNNEHGRYYSNSILSKKAIFINDDDEINQKEREKQLRELFKKHGHQIVFKGKSVKL
jgi:hypothetical protein